MNNQNKKDQSMSTTSSDTLLACSGNTAAASMSDWPVQFTNLPDVDAAQEAKLKRRKRICRGLIVLLLLLLIGLGAYSLATLEPQQIEVPNQSVAVMPSLDVNAEEITDKESLQAAMQEEADAHYFTLQVYPEASFSARTGEGSFSLMNPGTNVYPLSFEIMRDDTGETLYSSGTLLPGHQINTIALEVTPLLGTYDATVRVSIFDAETQTKEGETEAKITLFVV